MGQMQAAMGAPDKDPQVAHQADVVIRAEAVRKNYDGVEALKGITLSVCAGELFALLGPNGAGKTTLVHILCTILQPTDGYAEVGGYDVVKDPAGARRSIGVVFQTPSLDDRLTVSENLDFHARVFGVLGRRERRKRIEDALALVGLQDWQGELVRSLSGGMKRRLEIARCLIHEPKILFLDEPTVGLDAQTRARIWDHIEQLRRERNLTTFVTTHYIDEVERCDRVAIIDRGELLALGAPGALKQQYGRERLILRMRSDESERAVLRAYPSAATRLDDGSIVLVSDGEAFIDAFMSRFGSETRGLAIKSPSLEDVFLTLTGREIREQAATGRDILYSFAQRGGEHTR